MSDRLSIGALVIETMIRHLPPSASTLHLLDVNGALGDILSQRRADLAVSVGAPEDENRFDAVIVYAAALDDELRRAALRALRPGGRLIAIDPAGEPSAAQVKTLENAGYTRILVEELLSDAGGVLLRGEKPHLTADTLARIQSVAALDAPEVEHAQAEFKGRYLHLLIRQTPNKPVWALKAGEVVEWRALALADAGDPLLLAFSSLPNAVAFMQPAVLSGSVRDVNKVAKFSRAAAQGWHLLINPAVDVLRGREVVLVPVDPASAETADE